MSTILSTSYNFFAFQCTPLSYKVQKRVLSVIQTDGNQYSKVQTTAIHQLSSLQNPTSSRLLFYKMSDLVLPRIRPDYFIKGIFSSPSSPSPEPSPLTIRRPESFLHHVDRLGSTADRLYGILVLGIPARVHPAVLAS